MKRTKQYAIYVAILLLLPLSIILVKSASGRDDSRHSYDAIGEESEASEMSEKTESVEESEASEADTDNRDDDKKEKKERKEEKREEKIREEKQEREKKDDKEDKDIESKQIQKLIKETKIVKPRNKTVITDDTFQVEVQASEATGVEVYAKRKNSQQKKYLGKLSSNKNDFWNLAVKTDKRMPNGEYDLIVKVKNSSGEYEVGPVAISVERYSTIGDGTEVEADGKDLNKYTKQDDEYTIDQDGNKIKSRRAKEVKKTKLENLTGEEQKLVMNQEEDFDHDGLTNKEEERLGTNPFLADSDKDGFLDGDEIKNGYNPLQFSPGDKSDKMIFQDPREKGKIKNDLKIEEVKLVEKEIRKDESEEAISKKENKIRLTGKAIPNTFINIYIYSNAPVIVTVKTDENGNWSYDLDKNLENGDHEAYVVMTDNAGKITAKSKPIYFVKTAQAVTMENYGFDNQVKSPIETSQRDSLLYLVLIAIAFSGIAIIIIGIVTDRRINKK